MAEARFEDCLSAETIAAWAAGRLAAPDLEAAEGHVAFCSRCLDRLGDAAEGLDSALPSSNAALQDFEASAAWTELERLAEAGPHPADDATGSTLPLAPELIAGRFVRKEFIAQGGMGDVYAGEDRDTGTRVAIKQLKPGLAHDATLIARFAREGEILSRLNHPHIVKTLAVVAGRQHSIVMEYVGGGSLRQLLRRQGALAMTHALRLACDIADALSRAHALDVIHRDIKPENVLLDDAGSARLTDFGLARMGERSLTEPGTVIGTVAYLSPEVLSAREADARSDLWALGVMCLEMLTGKHPFVARTPGATLQAILTEPLPDLRASSHGFPPALTELLERMLARQRAQRIGSAREIAIALEAILVELDARD